MVELDPLTLSIILILIESIINNFAVESPKIRRLTVIFNKKKICHRLRIHNHNFQSCLIDC